MTPKPHEPTETPSFPSRTRLSELDALRGLAALFVLFFHYSLNGRPSYPVMRFGVTGVDLFFIISGFVIMMSLERIKHGYEFIISRFCRLFPTYWTAVTFALIVILCTKPYYGHPLVIPWEQYFANMTMFQMYFGHEDLDGPYWTMIVEMLFYIFMLFLFYQKALKSAVLILTILVLFVLILTENYWTDRFPYAFLTNVPLLQFLPLFLSGILFYRLFNMEKKNVWYILLIIGCYLAQVLLYHFSGRARGHISHAEYKLVLGIFYALFFLFLFGKLKFIVNRYTLFLGKISFALYLIHQYLSINCIIPILVDEGMDYYIAAFAVALPISLLVATGITFWIEIPAGRWMKPRLYKVAHQLTALRLKLVAKFPSQSRSGVEM